MYFKTLCCLVCWKNRIKFAKQMLTTFQRIDRAKQLWLNKQRWASTHANRWNARRRLKTLPSIGRSNRSSFFKKPKISVAPTLSRCLKRFNVVFKSSIFTPLNFFRTIAHSTAILGRRLSNFLTVNLRFFTYVPCGIKMRKILSPLSPCYFKF